MAITDSLRDIAEAIRSKSGKTDPMQLKDMATEISALNSKEIISHIDIPNYVKDEALRVANEVKSVLRDESIVFLAMSDSHHYGDQSNTDASPNVDGNKTNIGNLHAAMAAKILSYMLNFDFVAHLGDSTWGNAKTTPQMLQSQMTDVLTMLRESHEGIPCFHAIGNHDTGIYYHDEMIKTQSGIYTESGDSLYNLYTALSDSNDTTIGGEVNGGYCYRDFTTKKLRVFLLNTSEALVANQKDEGTLGSQRVWLANALLDLNAKTDASNWGFVILSHYPADYGSTMPLSELLKAYVDGTSITISSQDGTTRTVNFASANKSKFIAQFHGHIHNFRADKLSVYKNGHAVSYDAWRICIPNGQYNRENYYTTQGSYTEIDFQEKDSSGQKLDYLKESNSARDTSFVINVINPSEKAIHSFCYGAGRNRVIGYGDTVYYSIISSLSKVAMSNEISNIESGKSFVSRLTPNEHCVISSVKVTMNGEDITSDVYSDNTINIESVTGDVVIVASAEIALACVNQIPISTDVNGNTYNGIGYKANTYVNNGVESACSGVFLTGFIPVKNGDIIRLQDMSFNSTNGNHRIMFYDNQKAYVAFAAASSSWPLDASRMNAHWDAYGNCTDFTINTGFSISINGTATSLGSTSFIRICCANISNSSILTINEEIKYADEVENTWSVVNNLTYVTNDNIATTIADGSSYTANIVVPAGYVLESIVVFMGDTNVTASAYSNGKVYIAKVTGNISITAVAFAENSTSYTNEIPRSTDDSGAIYGSDYDGDGQKDGYLVGKRLNSSGIDETKADSSVVGYIPCGVGDVVYLKNLSFEKNASGSLSSANQRIAFYDKNKVFITFSNAISTTIFNAQNYLDASGRWTRFTIPQSVTNDSGTKDITNVGFFRMNCAYIGADSIISINNEIV